VITCRYQLSSDQHGKCYTIVYQNIEKWYKYRRYEHRKIKQFLKNDLRFQTLHNHQERIIVKLFNYLGGAGEAGAKSGRVSITSSIQQSLVPSEIS